MQAALRLSGSQAAHSAMIGDTPYDVEAAARARVPAIALRCGGWWDDAAFAQASGDLRRSGRLLAHWRRSGAVGEAVTWVSG